MIDFDGRSVLVTGTNSGLGKFIHERIPTSIPLTRDNRDDILVGQKYDIIIHSAYNSLNVDFTDLNLKYVDDNLLLTSDLINLCDGCFVYVSSIDSVNKIESSYALFKKISEELIKSKIENHFIITFPILFKILKQFTKINFKTKQVFFLRRVIKFHI